MQDLITRHLMDVLAGDSRLLASGNAYNPNGGTNPAWPGYVYPDRTDVATAGYVNLFDEPAEPDSGQARPAIYPGTRGIESYDRMEFPTIGGPSGYTEYRVLSIPIFIAVQAQTKVAARSQRNQLAGNVRRILLSHIGSESGYWWALEMTGDVVGGIRQVSQVSGVGGFGLVDTGGAEASITIPVSIHYSFNSGSSS